MNKSPLDSWIEKKHHIDMSDRRNIERWQLQQLNNVIQYAKANSIFYRKHLSNCNSLSSLLELQNIPLMDSRNLMDVGGTMLCVSQGDIERVVTLDTTGTTNNPKRIYFTKQDQELTIDFFSNGISTLVKPLEKVGVFLPYERSGSVGDLLGRALQSLGAFPVSIGIITKIEEAVKILESEQLNVLVGIPTQILALAQYCSDYQVEHRVKRILLSTDFAASSLIYRIEKLLNCTVFNHYGMTETGLGGAVDCSAHIGMHIRENDLLFEVIDPDTLKLLPPGEEGELVFTTLTRTGMPFIRYRTGDYGSLSYEQCKCKSIVARIRNIGPRVSDYVMVGSQKVTIAQMDEIIFAIDEVVDYEVTGYSSEEITCEMAEQLLPYRGKRQLKK